MGPNNLPAPLTSFVGRERELGELHHILESRRLLTLTGDYVSVTFRGIRQPSFQARFLAMMSRPFGKNGNLILPSTRSSGGDELAGRHAYL